MKNDLVKTTVQNLLDQFARQDFPAEVGWQIIRRQSGLHAVPSDSWSPGNRWIMLACGTTDARGFGQWHHAGRRVKPGSKALYICAPNPRKITSDEDDDPEAARTIVAGFRWIPVFRIEDTTGQPVSSADYTPQILPPLFDVAAKLGASVKWQPFDGKTLGRYRPSSKEIVLSDQTALTYYHELLHHLDSQIEPIRPGRLAEAELVAEFGGSVLCAMQGITGYESSSYRYLRSYADGKEPQAVLRSIMAIAARVEKLVGIVLDAAEQTAGIPEALPASISA
ncbi:MAG: M48 family peptidase [Veillonellaceae bacterium]|nr:M48 family peptidase [Veillonellaceae bacterium]